MCGTAQAMRGSIDCGVRSTGGRGLVAPAGMDPASNFDPDLVHLDILSGLRIEAKAHGCEIPIALSFLTALYSRSSHIRFPSLLSAI